MQKKATSSQRFIVYLIIKSTKQPTVYIYIIIKQCQNIY